MGESRVWAIWCVELRAWCCNVDSQPETFTSESSAQIVAAHWKSENEYQVAIALKPARLGWDPAEVLVDEDGCMLPLTYEVRPYPGGTQAGHAVEAS